MRRPPVLAAALGTILAADLCLERFELPWLASGLLDEPAHVATAVLALANLPPAPAGWTASYLAGSVAVDADHLPLIPIRHTLRLEDPRPAAHTLLVPAGLGLAARLTRGSAREIVLGAAAGTCAHFLRDLATGSGLAPIQPVASWRIKVPRAAYFVAMSVLAMRVRLS